MIQDNVAKLTLKNHSNLIPYYYTKYILNYWFNFYASNFIWNFPGKFPDIYLTENPIFTSWLLAAAVQFIYIDLSSTKFERNNTASNLGLNEK